MSSVSPRGNSIAGETASEKTTDGVKVIARPAYMPERSDPEKGYYYFAYRIEIHNLRKDSVKLLSRHWIIIDSDGITSEVRGPGVVGETPIIQPGESFEYTSFCPLSTEFGTMEGSYEMEDEQKRRFSVEIGRFYLAANAGQID